MVDFLITAGVVEIGLTEVDYLGRESLGIATVAVSKRGPHSNPLEVIATPMTYQEFQDLGLILDSDIAMNYMPDPAESKFILTVANSPT